MGTTSKAVPDPRGTPRTATASTTGTWWGRWPALPCEGEEAGLREHADTVVEAVGGRRDLIVVVQSPGGFTAPLVCDRLPVRRQPDRPGEEPWPLPAWRPLPGAQPARRARRPARGPPGALVTALIGFS